MPVTGTLPCAGAPVSKRRMNTRAIASRIAILNCLSANTASTTVINCYRQFPFQGHSEPRRPLVSVYREGQEHVAGGAAGETVTAVEEHHAVGDRRAAAIERAAFGGDLIHRVEIAAGIEIPEDLTGLRGICAQVAAEGSREDRARHCRDCRGLRGIPCGLRGGRAPHLLAGVDAKSI